MQKACLIISFDCEGKWGFADRISSYHNAQLNNKNLIKAYTLLTDLLEKYYLKATFAFVSAFTLSFEEYKDYHIWFGDRKFNDRNWLCHFNKQVHSLNEREGWFCPEAFDIVRKKSIHEIATHGFTHLPFNQDLVEEDDIVHELEGIKAWQKWKNSPISTLVFPRNQVGFTSLLSRAGIQAYRDYPLYYHVKPRWAAELLKVIEKPEAQPHTIKNTTLKIPGGNLLAFRRQYKIPSNTMIIHRWKAMIDDAVNNKQVVHVWMHPHNVIDGIDQAYLFEQVLANASSYVKSGQLYNMTQHDYWSEITNG